MTLIQRFSFFFTFLFSVLLATAMIAVYLSFSHFRKKEFQNRLLEKAETTINLLLKVDGVDTTLLKTIELNTVNRLYKRKALVLDSELNIIYNTTNLRASRWSKDDLLSLKRKKVAFKKIGPYEISGSYYKVDNRDYYVLVSAEDQYGNTKLGHLRYILLITFLICSILVWILAFYVSRSGLKPLDKVRKDIQEITDKNLNKRLPELETNDELKALSNSFNQMMDRIDEAYQRQKEFNGNASHELRTPIARILLQLENVLQKNDIPDQVRRVLKSVTEDTSQLSEIVTSLLLLSEINSKGETFFSKVRLDEIIFNAASKISKLNKDLKFQFEIEDNGSQINLDIEADETLLLIAFTNLIRNAYLYSDNESVKCVISQVQNSIVVVITNSGITPDVDDTSTLFNTFSRGSNTADKAGSGIGLSIVKRILQHHKASINYEIPTKNLNKITVVIPTTELDISHS